jgi:cytochrome P450
MLQALQMPAIPALDFDPFGQKFFDNPYPDFAALREAGPVARLSRYGIFGTGRYQEVCAVLSDHVNFCSSRGVGLTDYQKKPPYRGPSLVLETDPPLHTPRRAVLNRVLSPVAMKKLRADFSAAARGLVEKLLAGGEAWDGIHDIAEAFPLSVFPDAVGLPPGGRENLLPYGNFVFNSMGPENQLLRDSLAQVPPVAAWINAHCQRDALAADGFGAAIYAAADRGEILAEEAPLLVRSLLSAGLDTTVNGIGAALYCFARFSDQWDRLRAEPSLARNAFEEAIRFESPVQTFFRTTTADVDLGGVRLPEGEKILLFFGAANRDPSRWEKPDTFDITRQTSGHVGFGGGIHMCVGQMLARLEGEVMLAALAERVARIELIAQPRRRYNNTLRGLAALPIRFFAA